MANWGAIGQLIGQGFNQGFNQGIEERLLQQRAIEQQKLQDKYVGEQVAKMLMDSEKNTEAYKKAQAQQQDLLSKQGNLQGQLNTVNAQMKPLIDIQSGNTNNTSDDALLIAMGIMPEQKKDSANIITKQLSDLATQQGNLETQLTSGQSEIDKINNYLNNPLSEANKRLYDLAMGGNTFATQQIKDKLFPQYNWQISKQDRFDPATQQYYEDTRLLGVDKQGNIITKDLGSNITGEDYTKYKADIELQKEIAKAGAKGSENARYYTPEQLDELYLLDKEVLDKYPQSKTVIGRLNQIGYSALIPDVFSAIKTGYQEVPEYKRGFFGGDNQEEIDKAINVNKNYLATRQAVLQLTGYDIADKNTTMAINRNKQSRLAELEDMGVEIVDNKNGTYTLNYGDDTETVSELELLQQGML